MKINASISRVATALARSGALTGALASSALLWQGPPVQAQDPGSFAVEGRASRPNAVFIFVDDMGWGDLGITGSDTNRTPHMDALARQGTLFTDFYVASPVCSPSRAACLTGQYPARHRLHGHIAAPEFNRQRGMADSLDPAAPSLPRQLRMAGYRTAHFGKWHLGSQHPVSAYGFDEAREANDPTWRLWQRTWESSREIADATIDFVNRHQRTHPGTPFYVQAWTILPHAPLEPTPEQLAPFASLSSSPRFTSAPQVYAATMADLDEQVGRIVRAIDDAGLSSNTLFLLTSDNGPEDMAIQGSRHSTFGSAGPFRGRKRSLYEGGVRVPLIARWSGRVPANRVERQAVVGAVDLLPTLAHLAGAPLPSGAALDGENFAPALFGPWKRSKPLFFEWRFPIYGHVLHRSPSLAVREGDWKLLMNHDETRRELFDLGSDPGEQHNLATTHADVVRRLSALLSDWSRQLPEGPIHPQAGLNTYPWPQPKPVEALTATAN